jgi:hypothetical protein
MAELHYFQHREGGTIHGFTMPLLPDLAEQVRKGVMVPVDAPPEPRTLDLPPAMVAEALAEEKKIRAKKRREELLAELAELGDDEDDDDTEAAPKPAAAVKLSTKASPTTTNGEIDEPFGSIEPPSPEHPRADGLSGGGTKTNRGRRQ